MKQTSTHNKHVSHQKTLGFRVNTTNANGKASTVGKRNANLAKGRRILQKERESCRRNANLAVSSVLSPSEHARLMSAMRK